MMINIKIKIEDIDNCKNFSHNTMIKYSKNTFIYINYNNDKNYNNNHNKRNKNNNYNKTYNKLNIIIIICIKLITIHIKIIVRIFNDNYVIKNSLFFLKNYCLIYIYLI